MKVDELSMIYSNKLKSIIQDVRKMKEDLLFKFVGSPEPRLKMESSILKMQGEIERIKNI